MEKTKLKKQTLHYIEYYSPGMNHIKISYNYTKFLHRHCVIIKMQL